jgi:hypothetical protein
LTFIPCIFSFAKNFKKKRYFYFSIEQNFPPANQKAGTSSRPLSCENIKQGFPFPSKCLPDIITKAKICQARKKFIRPVFVKNDMQIKAKKIFIF